MVADNLHGQEGSHRQGQSTSSWLSVFRGLLSWEPRQWLLF